MLLRTKLKGKSSDNWANGLFVTDCLENLSNSRGRSSEKDLGKDKSRGRLRSKSCEYAILYIRSFLSIQPSTTFSLLKKVGAPVVLFQFHWINCELHVNTIQNEVLSRN